MLEGRNSLLRFQDVTSKTQDFWLFFFFFDGFRHYDVPSHSVESGINFNFFLNQGEPVELPPIQVIIIIFITHAISHVVSLGGCDFVRWKWKHD